MHVGMCQGQSVPILVLNFWWQTLSLLVQPTLFSMDYLRFFMLADKQSCQAYQTGRAPWRQDESTWRSDGIDNALFAGKVVPFAKDEADALAKFQRAEVNGNATGPPICMFQGQIPAKAALQHIVNGDIKMFFNRREVTIGFTKPVNKVNYPLMEMDCQGEPVPILVLIIWWILQLPFDGDGCHHG